MLKFIKKVQEFDPPGIAARNLQECLLIQARMLGVKDLIVEIIIRDHLKDLELKLCSHRPQIKSSHSRSGNSSFVNQ